MARHPGSLEVDRSISQEEAMQILQLDAKRGPAANPQPVAEAAPVQAPAPQASAANNAGESAQPIPARNRLRRLLLAAAGVAALAAGAYFGWDYWTVGRFHVSTDDAYVQADNTTIAPKVSGYLAEVLVGGAECAGRKRQSCGQLRGGPQASQRCLGVGVQHDNLERAALPIQRRGDPSPAERRF